MQAQQILIELDAFTDNPIPLDVVRAGIEGEVTHYALSAHGGPQVAPRGDGMPWRRWCRAVERILEAVNRDGSPAMQGNRHYHIFGRGPIPLFAFVGSRLSKWATITVHNQSGPLDRITLPQGDMPLPTEPRFFAEPRFYEGTDGEGKVGLYLSTKFAMSLPLLQRYMQGQAHPMAGVVALQAPPGSRLTDENGLAAAAEIEAALLDLAGRYPDHDGLVVFIAGPAQLGLIAGRAINPNIFTKFEAPNHAGSRYVPAIAFPFEDPPKILVAVADPSDLTPIGAAEELGEIKGMLAESLSKSPIEPQIVHETTHIRFLQELQRHDPQILHISTHGRPDGAMSLLARDGTTELALMEGVAKVIRLMKSVRVVLVNACFSKALADRLVALGVDYAIGYDEALHKRGAKAFSRGFYSALAAGKDLETAFATGQAAVETQDEPSERFYARAREGFDPRGWTPYPRRVW